MTVDEASQGPLRRTLAITRAGLAYALRRGRHPGQLTLPRKQFGELQFWRDEIERYCNWYAGRLDPYFGNPSPTAPDAAASVRDVLLAWAEIVVPRTYPEALGLAPGHFAGKRILDVGCGPFPLVLGFTDCEAYALDELIDRYRDAGFPLGEFPGSQRLTYLVGSAERIPAPEASFDAVISVNAIDHVADIEQAADEIARVLKPSGELHMEVHYHRPTEQEPVAFDDDTVLRVFGRHFVMRKADERTGAEFDAAHDDELLAVWRGVHRAGASSST